MEQHCGDAYNFISRAAGRGIGQRARDRRQRALRVVEEYHVSVTRNGTDLIELTFDKPPTLCEVMEHSGGDAFVVGIRTTRRTVPAFKRPSGAVAAE